jgi:hypothetical protein
MPTKAFVRPYALTRAHVRATKTIERLNGLEVKRRAGLREPGVRRQGGTLYALPSGIDRLIG